MKFDNITLEYLGAKPGNIQIINDSISGINITAEATRKYLDEGIENLVFASIKGDAVVLWPGDPELVIWKGIEHIGPRYNVSLHFGGDMDLFGIKYLSIADSRDESSREVRLQYTQDTRSTFNLYGLNNSTMDEVLSQEGPNFHTRSLDALRRKLFPHPLELDESQFIFTNPKELEAFRAAKSKRS